MVMMELQGFDLFSCHLLHIPSVTEDMLELQPLFRVCWHDFILYWPSGSYFSSLTVTTAKRKRENLFFLLAPSAGWLLRKWEFEFAGVCAGMSPDL